MINFPPEDLMQHKPMIIGFVRRWLRDREAAEDIVSETFLKAITSPVMFRGSCKVSTWLVMIARRETLQYIRRMQAQKRANVAFSSELVDYYANILCSADDALAQVIWHERFDQFLEQVARLIPCQRDAMLQYIHCNGDMQATCIAMGRCQNTIKSYIAKARKTLRETLGQIDPC